MEKKLIAREKKLDQVMAEFRSLSELRHRNLVKFECSYRDEICFYMISELVPGGELFEHISKMGPLATTSVRYAAFELLSVLEYMHTQGYLHRDVKPEVSWGWNLPDPCVARD